MLCRLLTPEDQPALIACLRPQADSSLFILNNQAKSGITDGTAPFQGKYYGHFNAETLKALLVRYWNGIIMMQGDLNDVLTLWRKFQADLDPITGFIGPAHLCHALRDIYESHAKPRKLKLDSTDFLYTLDIKNVRTFPPSTLTCRLATRTDADIVRPWMESYHQTIFNLDPNPHMAQEIEKIFQAQLDANMLYLLCDNNIPVCMNVITAHYDHIIQIGSVWTPPALRNKGYARSLVAATLEHAKKSGISRAILTTGQANLAAQRAYEAIGFQKQGEFGLFLYAEECSEGQPKR